MHFTLHLAQWLMPARHVLARKKWFRTGTENRRTNAKQWQFWRRPVRRWSRQIFVLVAQALGKEVVQKLMGKKKVLKQMFGAVKSGGNQNSGDSWSKSRSKKGDSISSMGGERKKCITHVVFNKLASYLSKWSITLKDCRAPLADFQALVE